jgi:type II secretory pathway pseudopilin PulG
MTLAPIRRGKDTQAGYVLLVLLLFLSLLVIAAAAVAPSIGVAIQRDREEELIHRGVQYTRAIRKFTRKFGHYPASLDELQNSNGQRFLRRKYKDPITGKDFKLLHFADVQLSNGPGVAAFTLASQPPGTQPPDTDGTQSSTATNSSPAVAPQPGTDATDPVAGPPSSGPVVSTPNALSSPGGVLGGGSSSRLGSGTPASQFGGGAILGVASTSKRKGFHEFDHKSQYADWKFYFDPGFDRGFPITGPTVRPVLTAAPVTDQNAAAEDPPQPGDNQKSQ